MGSKIVGVVLGTAFALAVLALLGRIGRTAGHTLLSESDGEIRTVAIQFTREAAPFTGPCLKAFLQAAGRGVRVVAVCGDERDAAAARRSLGVSRTVVIGKPITGWCKDRFLVGRGTPALLIRPEPLPTGRAGRDHDALVAGALARSDPGAFRDVTVPLEFDAGDILVAGDKVIVSDTLWEKNGRRAGFKAELERLFDHEVVWLRGVPDHHIGMFAAPLADGTILVGDPDLARSAWSPALDRRFGKADFSPATVATFHAAAEQLRAAGFRVEGVPTVPIGPKVYITYTNGVFDSRTAYMPVYGIPALDAAGRSAFEAEGLAVKPIPVESVYRFRGTIGCLVNVLERR